MFEIFKLYAKKYFRSKKKYDRDKITTKPGAKILGRQELSKPIKYSKFFRAAFLDYSILFRALESRNS